MEEGAGGLTNWDEEFHFIPLQLAWSLKSQVPLVQPLICQDQEDVSLYPCSQVQEVIKQSCSQLYVCHQFHRFPRLAGIHRTNPFASLISIASLGSNFLGLVLPLPFFNVFPASKMMSLLFPHPSLTVYALKKKFPLLPSGRNMHVQSAMLNRYSLCETPPSLS